MKYWVYINDKVTGPFTADKLVTLTGFTPDTLICSEDAANSGNQEWVKASNIFEFEQPAPVAPAPAPAVEPVPATAAAPASAATDAVTAALLAKLDALTNQLTTLQSKMEGMQTKLDESLATQQKMAEEAAQRVDALSEQVTHISAAQQTSSKESVNEIEEANLDDNSENEDFISSAEETANKTSTQVPLGTAKTMDLTLPPENTEKEPSESASESSSEENLLVNGDEEVLSSALDSLHNTKIQTQEEKESTFQDLLTPVQAEALAKEAKANQEKAKAEQEKEEVLAEFTAAKEQADVVDQVIKEKEEDESKKSMTMRWLSAGAAVLAGAVGLKKKSDAAKEETSSEKKDEPVKLAEDSTTQAAEQTEQPAAEPAQLDALHPQEAVALSGEPSEEPVLSEQPEQEKSADLEGISATEAEQARQDVPTEEEQPQEKQTLDFDNPQDSPALSIAPDPAQPSQAEEISTVEPEQQMQAVDQPTAEEVAPQPVSQTKIGEELQAAVANQAVMPSLGDEAREIEKAAQGDSTEEPVQELVPDAKMEKPDDIISEADLKDAFSESKAKEDSSVEQLFGLASAGAAVAASVAADEQSAAPQSDNLPSLEQAEVNAPVPQENKANDPTEIELKAGSTYLISDFVPPVLASGTKNVQSPDPQLVDPNADKKEDDDFELQEIVTHPAVNPDDDGKENKGVEASDVTVSQIVLENTIKAKRGAALDIKTVPMVPEPAQSDRLQIDGMDDINTQHDIKSADVEPAGKGARMFVGLLAILLLLSLIYGMMAFMNWIPPQFNLLAKPQQTAEEQQEAQLNEMLGEDTMPVQTVDENMPVGVENSQEAILEEVKNYMLPNGMTLKAFIESKHPAATELITWEISTAVDPDNYSVLVKVPPENPQSFKISYRFNYNAVTKALDPTISDAKNLLDSAQPAIVYIDNADVKDFLTIKNSIGELSYLSSCLQAQTDVFKGYQSCICEKNDQKAIAILQNWKDILARHPQWPAYATLNWMEKKDGKVVQTHAVGLQAVNSILQSTKTCI